MGFRVEEDDGDVTVSLSGWDWIMLWRRKVRFEASHIRRVSLIRRGVLERTVQHRELGVGTHDGARHPGRRRVGIMLGRGVVGGQFWAVPKGGPDSVMVVLDLEGHRFVRAVLDVADTRSFNPTE